MPDPGLRLVLVNKPPNLCNYDEFGTNIRKRGALISKMNTIVDMTQRLLIGRSPAMQRVRSQIELLARSRASVLIQGESGTGKELVARALHVSARRGEFVPIDCGSFANTLIESELFGHARGAFTGATEQRRGLIEGANGGTAFFDEIGDMPLDLQVKLLRVIQEREIRPLGSLSRVKVDIRVVSATHRDLVREVSTGRFREDLYYRLNVVCIFLPPLRERRRTSRCSWSGFLQTLKQPTR